MSESKPLLAPGFQTALDAYRATAARSLPFLSSPALLKTRSRDHFFRAWDRTGCSPDFT